MANPATPGPTTAPSRRERIEGGVFGLLVGDALGVPYEFHPPAELPAQVDLEFVPPAWFRRAHHGVAPGTWSDDGAHALCLLASLLDRGGLDPDDLGRRIVNWHDWGYMAVDHHVYDCGITTRRAVGALRDGVPALSAGPATERDNGNGALMRVLPLALFHRGSDEDLARDAHAQSRVTHGHARSQVCCALYCLWARRLLAGAASEDGWRGAAAALRALYAAAPEFASHATELEEHVRPDAPADGSGSGYVVDTLTSARLAMAERDYESVVKAAIALGHDTDTTACVAGGLAGARDGVAAIPARWRDALRGRELAEPLVAALLAAAG